MSPLSVRLPDSVNRHIKEFAQKEGVSINSLQVPWLKKSP
jgi:predicted HicB family RNase H-like nuclease